MLTDLEQEKNEERKNAMDFLELLSVCDAETKQEVLSILVEMLCRRRGLAGLQKEAS